MQLHKERPLCAVAVAFGGKSTFRTLPCVPQVLHTDELVIPVEAVMLGLGVMVVQIFS